MLFLLTGWRWRCYLQLKEIISWAWERGRRCWWEGWERRRQRVLPGAGLAGPPAQGGSRSCRWRRRPWGTRRPRPARQNTPRWDRGSGLINYCQCWYSQIWEYFRHRGRWGIWSVWWERIPPWFPLLDNPPGRTEVSPLHFHSMITELW